VTVGAGRPARGYPGDPHQVSVEGQPEIDDELTTDDAPTLEHTVTLDITDGGFSLVAGGRSPSTGERLHVPRVPGDRARGVAVSRERQLTAPHARAVR